MPGVPVHVYQVFQLTEGDYSQPLGSLGIIMRLVGTNACEVQWLSGSYSLPVLTEHLTEVGTIALPIENAYAARHPSRERDLPLTGMRVLRWKAAVRLYRLGCAVSGRHEQLLQWDEAWKQWFCPHCGWSPEDEVQ